VHRIRSNSGRPGRRPPTKAAPTARSSSTTRASRLRSTPPWSRVSRATASASSGPAVTATDRNRPTPPRSTRSGAFARCPSKDCDDATQYATRRVGRCWQGTSSAVVRGVGQLASPERQACDLPWRALRLESTLFRNSPATRACGQPAHRARTRLVFFDPRPLRSARVFTSSAVSALRLEASRLGVVDATMLVRSGRVASTRPSRMRGIMRGRPWPRRARSRVPSLARRAVQARKLDGTVCPETCQVERACRGPFVAGGGGPGWARGGAGAGGYHLHCGRGRGVLWRLRPARFWPAAFGASCDGPIWTGDGFASGA